MSTKVKTLQLSVVSLVISVFSAFAAGGPLLVPDYDRDGKIDEFGYKRAAAFDSFPVLVDVSEVTGWDGLTWKLCGAGVNVVFTKLEATSAGTFHTQAVNAFGGETPLYCAEVAALTKDGVKLPGDFLQKGWGVFAFEGAATNDVEMMLCGSNGDGECVCSNRLNLAVRNVEEMYGWINLRGKAEVERLGGGGQIRWRWTAEG